MSERRRHHASQSGSNIHVTATQSSDGTDQSYLNNEVLKQYCIGLTKCSTMGELLRHVPVPVQPISKDIFDGVYNAFQKLGTGEQLVAFWKDKLRSSDFAGVSQLNSIKAPVVQVSKEALVAENNQGLNSLDFATVISSSKRAALTQMILIKETEIAVLRDHVQTAHVGNRLEEAWNSVLEKETSIITREHQAILTEEEIVRRVAQVACSVGESAFQKSVLSKKRRTEQRREADVEMTDVVSKPHQKQLASLIEEVLRRKDQSRKDRTLSGKGKGRAQSPKKQKNTGKGKKPQSGVRRNKKQTGTGKQHKKR